MLRSSTTELAPTNVCLLVYLTPFLIDDPTAEDILVIKNSDQPEWLWGAGISEVDGRWLELYISRDSSRVCFSVPLVFSLTRTGDRKIYFG